MSVHWGCWPHVPSQKPRDLGAPRTLWTLHRPTTSQVGAAHRAPAAGGQPGSLRYAPHPRVTNRKHPGVAAVMVPDYLQHPNQWDAGREGPKGVHLSAGGGGREPSEAGRGAGWGLEGGAPRLRPEFRRAGVWALRSLCPPDLQF